MFDFIINFIAILIIIPIIATFLVYIISEKIVGHKRRAIHIAINWTTILYILATDMLLVTFFKQPFGGIIIGLLLFILGIIIMIQWRTKTEIVLGRAIKILWRFCFLFFSFTYIILVVFGIAQSILFD